MAKEPEVPGQEYKVLWPDGHGPEDQRQLSCGCWVALDYVGACAVHGPMPSILRPGRIIEPAPFVPTWLDEVAARVMAETPKPVPDRWDAVGDEARAQWRSSAAKEAYLMAKALLAEGKKRREAKGE